MNFWELMVIKDDYILSFISKILSVKSAFKFGVRRVLNSMKAPYKNKFAGRSIYIVLNGPSVSNQDLSVLQGKDIMFVNRGFKHPLYAQLQPKFHVFVDPKMLSGEWDVAWIDEIQAMVPDITFVMPVEWYFAEKFQPYIKRGVPILWIRSGVGLRCTGVSGECFSTAMFLGYKDIYFTGFDGNGIAYELVKRSSHFYGVNEENLLKDSNNYIVDLYMHSRHLHDLRRFSRMAKKKNVNIYNVTDGGIMDMFERKKFEDIK